MENGELSLERKDALCNSMRALYNPVQLQQSCHQGYLALTSTARSGKPCSDAGSGIAMATFSKKDISCYYFTLPCRNIQRLINAKADAAL
jgi:hypothetical protein